jgi:hypothetical protein
MDNIEQIESIKKDLFKMNERIQSLLKRCENLTPFKLRRQKLKSPYNKCKCLINYKKSQVFRNAFLILPPKVINRKYFLDMTE